MPTDLAVSREDVPSSNTLSDSVEQTMYVTNLDTYHHDHAYRSKVDVANCFIFVKRTQPSGNVNIQKL